MKFISVFMLAFFLVNNLWAFPESGDFVHFEAIYEGKKVVLEKKILEHNKETDIFKVRSLMLYDDQIVQDQIFDQPRNFLYSTEKVNHVLSTCEAREGALGEITLGSKNFKVCEFYDEDSQLTSMIGMVPFGVVRFQQYLQGEEFLDYNLTKFTLGEEASTR